ncbi:hypothetical protein ACWT_3365 [Actinoplanes sp. SE50]|uniref:helix-turn-helix transcriptional regulator n=1 Tax=unclassified Actinoplanes TaxID=2626549 RepID=UPI00023ED07A|nr:hypothetical protein ACPL_3493 [Actinoplanes sp. SE50/110]ATO82780.1 hypothetical protein ACWT_3365 [Actinoplanes sp. SE50]SLM00188.1 putative transcriptional regulator [Actinoplanes sp. SE50/110]
MQRAVVHQASARELSDSLRLVGAREIAIRLGLSRQRIQQLADRDDFPAPFQELKMGRVWWAHQVEEWIREWHAGKLPEPPMKEETVEDFARLLAERTADQLAERAEVFLDDDLIAVLAQWMRVFLDANGITPTHRLLNQHHR